MAARVQSRLRNFCESDPRINWGWIRETIGIPGRTIQEKAKEGKSMTMVQWRPDPTFYPSPRMAMEAPSEKLAYLALLDPKLAGKPDAIAVVDVDPTSKTYSQVVGQVEMPNAGDELHHFGWNACSSCLSPYAPHAHMERRYLIVPGLRSSRIHVIDTKPDPRQPKIVK